MNVEKIQVDGKVYYKLRDIANVISAANIHTHAKSANVNTILRDLGHVRKNYIDSENIIKLIAYYNGKDAHWQQYGQKLQEWFDSVSSESVVEEQHETGFISNEASEMLKSFVSQEFGLIRIVMMGNEPWFVLKDVCNALELSNPSMVVKKLDDDEKGVSQIYTPGGLQEMIIINESGLYTVILRSDKLQAKNFRKWVTSEVLPSIRKHGMYATEELLNNPELAIKAFTALRDEREKNRQLQEENDNLNLVNQGLVHDTRTWNNRAIFNALMRSLAANCYHNNFQCAYNIFYRQLLYKKGINLKLRSGDGSYIDRIRNDEWVHVVEVAVAMCESNHLNVPSIINEANAERVCTNG
jgi:prophage antirepressor-like protein